MGGQQQGGSSVQQPSAPAAPAPMGPGPQMFGGFGAPRMPFTGGGFAGGPQQLQAMQGSGGSPPTGFGPAQNLGAQGNQPGPWVPSAANQWQSGPPAPIGMSAQVRPPTPPPPTPMQNIQGPQMGGFGSSTGLSPQPMNIFGSLTGGGAGKF